MPPKRKASFSQKSDEPPATRQRTRSIAANFSSPSRSPLSRGVNASPSSVRSPVKPLPEPAPSSTPMRDDNDKRLTRSQTKRSAIVHSKRRGVSSSDREDDQSEDELILPSKKMKNRKRSENVSSTASKVSPLPRVFVEIVSPASRIPKHLAAKAVAHPASPTLRRSKVTRKLSPSPSPPPVFTKAATAKRIHPSKQLAKPALPAGGSTLPHGLSRLPASCIHAQKRAILNVLHNPKTAVFGREDENGELSANAVALEQLKALLTGTLERGEGNSCLLIGPRGSGKSRVSICTLDSNTVR
jgi:hypothetical protein